MAAFHCCTNAEKEGIRRRTVEKRHYDFLDAMKGMGILLVVLGHVSLIEPLNTVIYAFHMPLFFFISGFLFFSSRKEHFAVRRVKPF